MRELIFKGATRPPMKWGVPLMALVCVFMPGILLLMWAALGAIYTVGATGLLVAAVGGLLLASAFIWMRWITARDDQRLGQVFKVLKLRSINRNRSLFKYRSFGPYRAAKAHHGWRR